MNINKKNYKKVLENIAKQIEDGDNDTQLCWFANLDYILDAMQDGDFFGTEGQNDPRGDHRR